MSMNNLAGMLKHGEGTDKDPEKAVEWLTKAAEQDYAPAQGALAICFERGIGTDKDEEKAVEWYQRAVTGGNAGAMNNLACMLYDGRGCQRDDAAAVALYEQAAALGCEAAQSCLAQRALRVARAGDDEIAKGKAEKAAVVANKAVLESGTLSNPTEVAADFDSLKLERICDACGKTEAQANAENDKLRYCGFCKLAKYCSAKCSGAAWPKHQKACLEARAEREAKAKA